MKVEFHRGGYGIKPNGVWVINNTTYERLCNLDMQIHNSRDWLWLNVAFRIPYLMFYVWRVHWLCVFAEHWPLQTLKVSKICKLQSIHREKRLFIRACAQSSENHSCVFKSPLWICSSLSSVGLRDFERKEGAWRGASVPNYHCTIYFKSCS